MKWLLASVIGMVCLFDIQAKTIRPLSKSRVIQEKIESIPLKDRLILEVFFKSLLAKGEFATTLFQEKSMSTHDFFGEYIFGAMVFYFCDYSPFLELQGWRVWSKYQTLFATHFYKFKIFEKTDGEGPFYDSYFICQNRFEERRKSLKNISSLDDFFYKITQGADNEYHRILGTGVGYPKEAVEYFVREVNVDHTLAFFPYEVNEEVQENKWGLLLDGYPENLTKGPKRVFRQSWSWKENPFFCSYPYVYGFDSPKTEDETTHLLKQRIMDLYNSDHFLEDFFYLIEYGEIV